MNHKNLIVRPWRDYEFIDSGDNRKLERFGKYILIRPETQALWRPMRPEEWKRANAEFKFDGGKGGAWVNKKNMPEEWEMAWGDAHFIMRLTSFKHTGVFPEQVANWEWIAEQVQQLQKKRATQRPKILNLFGYTGVASIVAAQAGASVTHVDASRQSNEWAKENARLSEVPEENIRYLFDDALKFVEREARRSEKGGAEYDGIIVDPPAFGRGAKGEVWKIEEGLPQLLDALAKILSKKPGAFFLLNGYAAGYSPSSLMQATASAFPEIKKSLKNSPAEFGELQIEASSEGQSAHVVPSGIYVRFVR